MTIIFRTATLLISTVFIASPALAGQFGSYAKQAAKYYNSANTPVADAHSACKSNETKRKFIGGGFGGTIGGVAGSKIAGKSDLTKGLLIGSTIGGLAGVGIADKTVDCDPAYYEPANTSYHGQQTSSAQSQPVYSQNQPVYTQSQTGYSQHKPVYSQSPIVYSPSQAVYSQTRPVQNETYPVRTVVSDHPVYSNRSYSSSTPAYTAASQAVQTSSQQPRLIRSRHASTTAAPIRYVTPARKHYHGKYACSAPH